MYKIKTDIHIALTEFELLSKNNKHIFSGFYVTANVEKLNYEQI